jgi:hypothetical protein
MALFISPVLKRYSPTFSVVLPIAYCPQQGGVIDLPKITHMQNEEVKPEIKPDLKPRYSRDKNNIWVGFLLLIVGGVLFAKQAGVLFPAWMFSWHFVLIVLGLLVGIRHGFRNALWLILILVGSFFLLEDFYPTLAIRQYEWPLGIIAMGIFFIFRPKNHNKKIWWEQWEEQYKNEKGRQRKNARKAQWEKYRETYTTGYASGEDYIDVVSVLGGIKKNILSKNFKGGESISFLGGTELNLSQADINGRVVLELTQILGGTKLIIPPHWDVRSELITVFGSIDDKRSLENVVIDENKILVLKGVSVLGGIDIRSY